MNEAVHVLDTNHAELDSRAIRRDIGPAGARITWRTWGAGPHVVLLHGSAGSWDHWIRNLDALAANHTVHVPDLPGCGDSDISPHPAEFRLLAQSLAESFDQLEPSLPMFDLVGFSFGSLLAEEWAVMRQGRLSRVVLVRGNFDGSTPVGPKGLVKWRHITDPEELMAAHRQNMAALMLHDASMIDASAIAMYARNSARTRLNQPAYSSSRTPGLLGRIEAPVHAITGEFDSLSGGLHEAQRNAFFQERPEGSFQMIVGAGHWVAYEAAVEFNEALLRVLSDSLARN